MRNCWYIPSKEVLLGVAVTWYTNLEPSRVHSWKDLMVAFVRQYRYNSDMAPDRMQLQNMCKKGDNNRDGRHIIGTLLWKMVGYTPSSFADLVFAGKMIEVGLKRGKSDHHALINAKKLGQMKRVRMREKPMLWLSFLYSQVSHQPNIVITQPITNLLITHRPVIHKGNP